MRITAHEGPNGEAVVSSGSLDSKLAEQKPETKPNAAAHQGGVRYKAQVGTDGEITVTRSVATGSVKSEPRPGAFATDPVLGPISIERASANSVITIPNMGDSTAAAWEQMGMLRRLPTGGFELAGEARQAAEAQAAQPNTPPAPKDAPTPIDPKVMDGVQGLSESSDAIVAKLTSVSPITIEGMVETAARGGLIDYGEIGKSMNDEGAAARLEVAVDQTRAAGIRILANLGIENAAAFENHLRATNPELASTIVREMFTSRSTESLIRAGIAYRDQRAQKVAQISTAKNVEAKVENGQVFFSRTALGLAKTRAMGDFPASDWISEKDARAAGVIDVVEQK